MVVFQGRVRPAPDFTSLIANQRARSYLGHLIDAQSSPGDSTPSAAAPAIRPLYRR
jgi:hypothetical protein